MTHTGTPGTRKSTKHAMTTTRTTLPMVMTVLAVPALAIILPKIGPSTRPSTAMSADASPAAVAEPMVWQMGSFVRVRMMKPAMKKTIVIEPKLCRKLEAVRTSTLRFLRVSIGMMASLPFFLMLMARRMRNTTAMTSSAVLSGVPNFT